MATNTRRVKRANHGKRPRNNLKRRKKRLGYGPGRRGSAVK